MATLEKETGVLYGPEASPNFKGYVDHLPKNEARHELESLFEAGLANVKKLEAAGWVHGLNEEVNAVDPDNARGMYTDNGLYIDHAAIEEQIARKQKALESLKRFDGVPTAPFGPLGAQQMRQAQTKKDLITSELNSLSQHNKWRLGLCREWAQSNGTAMAGAVKRTYYAVEYIQVINEVAGLAVPYSEHNVVRMVELFRDPARMVVLDSWKTPTRFMVWEEFFHFYRMDGVQRY